MTFIKDSDYDGYFGEEIPLEDFDRYASRACEAVDAATGWKLSRMGGIEPLPELAQRLVKLACCTQAEYLYLQGADAALDGASGGGYQIGKTQMIASSGEHIGGRLAGGLCRKAWSALAATGLLYSGVQVC